MTPLTASAAESLPLEPNRAPAEDYPGGGSMAVALPSRSPIELPPSALVFQTPSDEEMESGSLASSLAAQMVPVAHAEWVDSGYRYEVSAESAGDRVVVNVSRILTQGRGSPLAGRRVFPGLRKGGLAAILETDAPVRTHLADQIIQGGAIELDTLLASVVQAEFWRPL